MKVILREAAAADLENIYNWIAKDSAKSARSVIGRIVDVIEELIPAFPFIGRSGKVAGTREWIVHGLPYIIVYEVDDHRELVTIIGVFHGAQDR